MCPDRTNEPNENVLMDCPGPSTLGKDCANQLLRKLISAAEMLFILCKVKLNKLIKQNKLQIFNT